LKRDFPELEIVINGGITRKPDIEPHLAHVDGVMLGRAAYHDPWLLADAGKTRAEVVLKMKNYLESHREFPVRAVTRHILGLYHGMPRARVWRRRLSDATLLAKN